MPDTTSWSPATSGRPTAWAPSANAMRRSWSACPASVDDGRVAWSTLLEADLVATGAEPSYSEGIIDLLAQAENAEVAILFKEADGQTRLSVRTRPEGVDAAMLTGQFGGGGHARA